MQNRQSGQTLPLFGILLMVLMGFIAMGVDLGQGYLERRQNQAGADAGSVAGMEAVLQGATDAGVKGSIKNTLIASGYSGASIVFATSSSPNAGTDASKTYVNAQYGAYGGSSSCQPLSPVQYVGQVGGNPPSSANCVKVTVTTSKVTLFANIPIIGVAQVGASATSSAGKVSVNTGNTPGANITGANYSNNTATFTFTQTSTAPTVGSSVTISGVGPSGYNGTYTVTSSTTTSVTVSFSGSNPGNYTSGGTISFNPISSVTTASCNAANNSITFTFSSLPSPPTVGSTITVTGVTPSGYDGTYTVTSSTKTTATVGGSGTCPSSYSSGGTIEFNSNQIPTPTPTPTAGPYDTGAGEGWAIWGGKRADSTILSVGSDVEFFADSGWNSSNDVQTNCNPCEYDATQNFKGIADDQCFQLPMQSTCTGPNGSHGNVAASLTPGTVIEVVVTSSVSHQGNENILTPIGLANITVLASCPTSPAYLRQGTNGVCGTIDYVVTGQLNEGVTATATPTSTAPAAAPTAVPTYSIGNTN